jgi:hypothetical protein
MRQEARANQWESNEILCWSCWERLQIKNCSLNHLQARVKSSCIPIWNCGYIFCADEPPVSLSSIAYSEDQTNALKRFIYYSQTDITNPAPTTHISKERKPLYPRQSLFTIDVELCALSILLNCIFQALLWIVSLVPHHNHWTVILAEPHTIRTPLSHTHLFDTWKMINLFI